MDKTHRMVTIAIYVSLALALDYAKELLPFLNMSSGGSINIALIPIVVASFQLGWIDGTLAGLLWWLISSILGLNPYYLNIMQYIVDYILPSAIVGLSSMLYRNGKLWEMELGIFMTMIIRTFLLVLSGAIFWAEEGSLASWAFSMAYNLPYSLATMAMLMLTVPFILRSLRKQL